MTFTIVTGTQTLRFRSR